MTDTCLKLTLAWFNGYGSRDYSDVLLFKSVLPPTFSHLACPLPRPRLSFGFPPPCLQPIFLFPIYPTAFRFFFLFPTSGPIPANPTLSTPEPYPNSYFTHLPFLISTPVSCHTLSVCDITIPPCGNIQFPQHPSLPLSSSLRICHTLNPAALPPPVFMLQEVPLLPGPGPT